MNKSKFLKKSLAMLLAVMLVVAMIPMGAAAADAPTFTEAYVSVDNGSTWAPAVINGTSITADVSDTAQTFALKLHATNGKGTVTYTNQSRIPSFPDNATGSNGVWEITNLSAANYQSGTSYSIAVKIEDGELATNYTVALTPKPNKTDTSVLAMTVKQGTSAVPQLGGTVIDNVAHTIGITVPYDTTTIDVTKLTLPEGAKMFDAGNQEIKVGYQFTDITGGNTFAVSVRAGGVTAEYTLTFTKAVGINRLTVTDATEMKIFAEDTTSTVVVVLPYGYTAANAKAGTLTVTPEFALDYPSASLMADTDQTAGASHAAPATLKTGETKVKIDSTKVSTTTYDAVGGKLANADKWNDFKASCGAAAAMQAVVHYVEGTERVYDVYFVEPKKNPAAEITELTIGNDIATIDGQNISITLPDGTDPTKINDASAPLTAIEIAASANATVEIPTQSVTFTEAAGVFTAGTTAIDVTNPVVIRVTSEDTQKVVEYRLNVTINNKFESPVLKTMTLKDADGETYEAALSGKTFTFKLPYANSVPADLAGWKLYYTKSTGAQVATMDKTGAALVGSETFLPTQFDGVNPGSGITVTAYNTAEGSAESNVFNIIIQRMIPSDVKTLKSFALTEVSSFDALSADNTYNGSIDNTGKVIVTVPFSIYQRATSVLNALHSVSATTDENAVLYVNNAGTLTEVKDVAEGESSPTVYDGTNKKSNQSANKIDLVVLSERAAVDNKGITSFSSVQTTSPTGYTEYSLYVDSAAAEKGYTLSALKLVDPATDRTATLSIAGDKITGTVPYGMTGTPLYLDYTASKLAVLTSRDSGKAANQANALDSDSLPTGDVGIFSNVNGDIDNINRSTAAYVEVNSTTGVVTLYKHDATAGAVTNHLYITNEDGKAGFVDFTLALQVAAPNNEAQFKTFKINNMNGVIDNVNNTIKVELPYGSEVTSLKPEYTLSTGATTTFKSGAAAFNFSTPRNFTVMAEDGVTYKTYTVTVTVSDQFVDVAESDWFYKEVMEAARLGLVNGVGDNKFAPASNVKRGDFALMIARMEHFDETKYTESAFPDVESDSYYSAAIAYCADKGYVGGKEDGKFYAEKVITRQEMAKILCLAAGKTEISSPSESFADDASIANWAKGYVYAVKEAGLMNGVGGDKFAPNSNTPRSQAAAALVRLNNSK